MLQIFSRHRQTGKESADGNRRKRLVGKTLDRRYRIIDLLGEGGFSHTYIAEDTRRPKNPGYPKCVVKHLRKSSNNPDFLNNARRLFRTEAETLERLGEHHQIPRLLAYFEEWGEFYLVQEYIQGHPLSTEWKPGCCWSESQVYAFLSEMLEILVFVHGQGVIHRDVKPDNIIRRRHDRKLCLVDFGTVKQAVNAATPGSTQHTITTGTPGYIPIEQWRGNPQFNSDLYALGVVAVQVLTGMDPEAFQGNPERILKQHHPQINAALSTVIEKMVRADWHERYLSAQEVLQALQPLAGQFLPATAPPELFTPNTQSGTAPPVPASVTIVSSTSTSIPPVLPDPPIALDVAAAELDRADESNLADETVLGSSRLAEAPIYPTLEANIGSPSGAPGNEADLESALRSSLPKDLPTHSVEAESTEASDTMVASPIGDAHAHPITPSRQHLFWGIGVAGVGAIAASLFFLVLPWRDFQAAEQTLKQADQSRQAGNYGDCLKQAGAVPDKQVDLKVKAQELAQGCSTLIQASQLASASNFQAAIAALDGVAATNPTAADAQKLTQQWGDQLIRQATEKYQKGDFTGAIALLKNLPSALSARVQPQIEQWQGTWETNQDQLQSAQFAMEAGNWKEALEHASKIDTSDSPYWQKLVSQLRQEAQSNLEAAKAALAREQTAKLQPSEASSGWATESSSYGSPRQSAAPSVASPQNQRPQTATGSKICPPRVPGC